MIIIKIKLKVCILCALFAVELIALEAQPIVVNITPQQITGSTRCNLDLITEYTGDESLHCKFGNGVEVILHRQPMSRPIGRRFYPVIGPFNPDSTLEDVIGMSTQEEPMVFSGLKIQGTDRYTYMSGIKNWPKVSIQVFKLLATIAKSHIDRDEAQIFLNIGLFLLGSTDKISEAMIDAMFPGHHPRTPEEFRIFCTREISLERTPLTKQMAEILREAGFGELLS